MHGLLTVGVAATTAISVMRRGLEKPPELGENILS